MQAKVTVLVRYRFTPYSVSANYPVKFSGVWLLLAHQNASGASTRPLSLSSADKGKKFSNFSSSIGPTHAKHFINRIQNPELRFRQPILRLLVSL